MITYDKVFIEDKIVQKSIARKNWIAQRSSKDFIDWMFYSITYLLQLQYLKISREILLLLKP